MDRIRLRKDILETSDNPTKSFSEISMNTLRCSPVNEHFIMPLLPIYDKLKCSKGHNWGYGTPKAQFSYTRTTKLSKL